VNALLLCALLVPAAQGKAPTAENGCTVCHGREAVELAASIHAPAGLSCTRCHGGDALAMDKERGHGGDFTPLTDPAEAVRRCGGCHADFLEVGRYGIKTDQLALYEKSPHGRALFEKGRKRVATCLTCHGVHEIRRVSDPRSPANKRNQYRTCSGCHADTELMEEVGLNAQVPSLYRDSVHGRALLEDGNLASPGCTDCHGAHGAAPPRVADLAMVCGHCHTVTRGFFLQSPHFQATRDGLMEECTSCHGDHDVTRRGSEALLDPDVGCPSCHAGEPDGQAMRTAHRFDELLTGIDRDIAHCREELLHAQQRGVFIDDEEGYLQEAAALRIRGEPLSHTISETAMEDLDQRARAMLATTRESLEVKLRHLRDHRIFAAGFFVLTLLLAAFLRLYRSRLRS